MCAGCAGGDRSFRCSLSCGVGLPHGAGLRLHLANPLGKKGFLEAVQCVDGSSLFLRPLTLQTAVLC